ncbi:shikimate dehydrogenase [Microbacterium sp. 3J1]|uniref:shikimate dehydrogenase family protein n=1 Tax=Microbacterium sp. 3J1 TaxID=861269 RepID=UPI000AC0E531|nr:hypothetical protein [Microbacterium sp. 3J1]
MTRHRLAVWGDPIAHSRSPQLHAAAYGVLGLDWEYTRQRVDEPGFAAAFSSLDDSWRGLSLTMPLKEQAHRASATLDPHATLTGAVNTLLLGDRPAGFNTDVGGIIDALADERITAVRRARILGAGATAASALVAVAEMGAQSVDVRARRPERAASLVSLGERLGMAISVDDLTAHPRDVELTVATLPSGAALDRGTAARLAASGGTLFDVAYSPWPSSLSAIWGSERSVSGLGMLLHQAVRQIRVFLRGDPHLPVPDESAVVAAMRDALRD